MRTLIVRCIIVFLISCTSKNEIELKGTITSQGAGEIKLGNSIEATLMRINDITIRDADNGGYTIFRDSIEILSVWSKDQDSRIQSIEIKSSNFATEKGLKIGLSINDIISLYPSIRMSLDETDGTAYIAPEELQIYEGNVPVSLCLFYVAIDEDLNQVDFILNEMNQSFEADPTGLHGKIHSIRIYRWN